MANRRKQSVPDVDKDVTSSSSESPLDTEVTVKTEVADSIAHQSSPTEAPSDEVTLAEGPVETPSAPSDITDIVSSVRKLICIPRTRGAVPALISYKEGILKRYCILDVDGENLRKAWSLYKARSAAPNPADFVHMVINILNTDFPRMYRAVYPVPLD